VGSDTGLDVLGATRSQIELYVRATEAWGLAATTIDRRLSTVCGYYRFAHIDGRIASNPAHYVRRPKVHPSDARGLDRSELGARCSPPSASTTPHAALATCSGPAGERGMPQRRNGRGGHGPAHDTVQPCWLAAGHSASHNAVFPRPASPVRAGHHRHLRRLG
jgi:hypothetical protein